MSEGGSSLDRNIGRSPSLSEISVDPDYHPEFSLGMRPESKQLYRADDRSLWEDWAPDNAPEDVEAGSFAQECALIVRREPHPTNRRLTLHSITVQSPLIKRLLDGTFGGYEGVNTRLKQVTFKAPFHPFYYRWHLFEKLQLDEQDEDTKKHLDLLYPIVRNEILPHIEAMEDLVGNMVISFDLLWAIFSPGMEVYTRVDGQDRILSLRHSKYAATMEGTKFLMDCRYVDCDGSSFGYALWSLSIDTFDGIKAIVDLDVIPAHLHPNVEDLVDRLHARGQTFERLNGFHHMAYSGFYTDRSSRQTRKRHVQNSRIIIDPDSFNMYGTSGPTIDSLEPDSLVNATDSNNGSLDGIHNVIYRATSQAYQDFLKALDKCQKYRNSDLEDISLAARLSPLQRLLCAPVVRGYSLASKTWAEFYIDGVCPIRWSENAFSNLVLPHGYKDIIHAFVQEQLSRDDNFDDIIYGKGLGFIICLSGEPGVGKTLTAESVAEEMRQPLYSMSAGELGETAVEVEDSLELVLELTTKWNAILLLDECDIFLEARTSSDIRRNRLVSTFLKRLEYYRGVMFLTTNRVSSFDAAFESRIHLTIHYPSLDSTSRLHIWKTFVGIGGSGSQLTNSDLEILSRNELNGRQIKNVIKTARLLSKQKMAPLAMEHVEMVLRVKRGTFVDDI
ncbi:P-loop containing nucleoside triphosphate hydrolase protein [Thozetella sp. PMI_491]|nr:P-loop containing nucleoside triphosphate hydrolase protein [Thozetella sp. PMI_491]